MSRYIQLLISEDFAERTVPENDSVRLLDEIIDDLDLGCIYRTYSHLGRKCATSPRTLLKVLIYTKFRIIESKHSFTANFRLNTKKV